MFTPQEVQEKTFDKAVFGGYDMSSVDAFLEPLTEDYAAIYKENSILRSKMKLLVEKLEEYRNQEEAMRRTLVTAQKTADTMLEEAGRQAKDIVANAEASLRNRSREVESMLQGEEARIEKARQTAATFVEVIERDVARHLDILNSLKMMDLSKPTRAFDFDKAPTEPTPEPVAAQEPAKEPDFVAEIAENIGRMVGDSADMEGTLVASAGSKKYADLQFGKNYHPNN